VIAALEAGGVRFRRAENSLFVMVDLRDIAGQSAERELEVWRRMMRQYKVLVIPSHTGFHDVAIGWFRVCVSVVPELVTEGVARLVRAVTEIRAEQ